MSSQEAITSTTESIESRFRDKPLSPATLRELSARSDLQGLVRAASHYGAIVIVGTLIWLTSARYGIVWAVPLIFVQGYFVAFLFMVVHETAHKTPFRSRGLNLALGHLSSFAIGLPYEYYCLFHWDHHRYTQDPARDPELIVGPMPSSDTQLAIAYTGLLQMAYRVKLMFRHALTGKVSAPWIPEGKRRIVVREARLYVAAYVVLLLASFALSTTILLWVWIVPVLAGQMILRPYLYAEHTGCERDRKSTRLNSSHPSKSRMPSSA